MTPITRFRLDKPDLRKMFGLPIAMVIFLATFGAAVAQDETPDSQVIDRDSLKGYLIPLTGNTGVANLQVHFKLGSAKLTRQAMAQIEELAAALSSPELANFAVTINGHTDATGSAEFNKALSLQRASAVRTHLVSHHGLEESRLAVNGYGEEQLLEGLPPEDPANRRVEVVTERPPSQDDPADPSEGDDGMSAIN